MRERRRGMVRLLVIALIAVSSVLVGVMAWGTAKIQREPQTPAETWFSWSPETRAWHVGGYVAGFREGVRAGCSYHEDKIMPYLPKAPIPIEKSPKFVCLNDLPDFVRPTEEYVDAVTNYYVKYPRDREGGAPLILFYLASPPGLTIDEIHEKLTGKVGNSQAR